MVLAGKCDSEHQQGERATSFHGDLGLESGVAFSQDAAAMPQLRRNNIGFTEKNARGCFPTPERRATNLPLRPEA